MCCSLCTACCLPAAADVCCLQFSDRCLFFVGCLFVCCLPVGVCRLLFVVFGLFVAFVAFGVPVVCCNLFAVCCLMCVGC